jgi:ParB-like chromosome segregation protein Spo0J
MLGATWDHFGPVCLVLILGSQALNRRAHRIRWRNEMRSVRTGLRVNLHSLRMLYAENLQSVVHSRRTLASGRQQINLLKTQLGRLASLPENEVESVMLACIAAEKAESMLAVAGKALSPTSVVIHRRNEKLALVESALQDACSLLEAAEKLLGSNGKSGGEEKPDADADAAAPERQRLIVAPDFAAPLKDGTTFT